MKSKKKYKTKFRIKTDIGIITLLTVIILPIYPYTKPKITTCSECITIETLRRVYLKDENLWCSELLISGDFENKWIKTGYINSISVTPQFLNPNVQDNKKYIDCKVKYVDKKRIRYFRKTKFSTSVLLFYKSPAYVIGKNFEISFFDNNNTPVKDNISNSPVHLHFTYYEKKSIIQ